MKINGKEYKLPKDFKAKWIEALRSGKFCQGPDCLYNETEDSYCCLGVACIITGSPKSSLNNKWFIDNYRKNIPKVLRGSSDFNPLVSKLINYNDGNFGRGVGEKSFKWIANWIEKNL